MHPPPARLARAVAVTALALLPACPDLLPAAIDSAGGSGGSTAAPDPTGTTAAPDPTTGFELLCTPGQTRCDPEQAGVLETCKDTGAAWEQTPCAHDCVDDVGSAACVGPCDALTDDSSIGCEFIAIRMASFNAGPGFADALIVGNTDASELAAVQLHFTPTNDLVEQPIADPVVLAPGESHIFDIAGDPLPFTSFRTGGVFRLVSDRPVAAYLHSPLLNDASNDASMLLPVRSLRRDYVVASWPAFVNPDKPQENGRPSYFTIVALADDTRVEWTPKQTTAKLAEVIDEVAPGETGSEILQRFDVLQIAAASTVSTDYFHHDVSGTVIHADKDIWVMGATQCAFVPYGSGYCNHLQEQMLPLDYWGTTYIGPPSPPRADEKQYWRVYVGADDTAILVEGSDGTSASHVREERGEFVDLEAPFGVSLLFTGLNDAPILPVQYLAGNQAAGGIGDPAMVQQIPVEQWRDRYVFVTGAGYATNYAQIVRRTGAADVTLDGQVVGGYQLVNFKAGHNYEVANVPLPGGAEALTYVAASSDPFSVVVVGYNPAGPSGDNTSAYAYPGGMRLQKIYQP